MWAEVAPVLGKAQRPMAIPEIAGLMRGAGKTFTAEHPTQVVRAALNCRPDVFENVGKGRYAMKSWPTEWKKRDSPPALSNAAAAGGALRERLPAVRSFTAVALEAAWGHASRWDPTTPTLPKRPLKINGGFQGEQSAPRKGNAYACKSRRGPPHGKGSTSSCGAGPCGSSGREEEVANECRRVEAPVGISSPRDAGRRHDPELNPQPAPRAPHGPPCCHSGPGRGRVPRTIH